MEVQHIERFFLGGEFVDRVWRYPEKASGPEGIGIIAQFGSTASRYNVIHLFANFVKTGYLYLPGLHTHTIGRKPVADLTRQKLIDRDPLQIEGSPAIWLDKHYLFFAVHEMD